MYKIVGADGRQYGPASVDQLRHWIAENRVRGDTLVQLEGAQEWKVLNAFPELAAELKPPPVAATSPLPGVPPTIAARAANKIAAGVCGILLCAFGVHKFILGYSGAGAIMLATSLCCAVGGFLTCGVSWLGYAAMHMIGLIEGILYLTKSDEEFVRTYVDQRREWF